MNLFRLLILVLLVVRWTGFALAAPPSLKKAVPIFDGRTLAGWEGDPKFWRVQDGVITGGSLTEAMTHNDFLCGTRAYTNFILRLKFKISGTEGFVNSGVQVRSRRVPNDHEVSGYQCDLGDPGWWGTIYDEARRNRVLVQSDMAVVGPALRRGDWNEYVIRADGPRLTTWINGVQAADYFEEDENIPDHGVFGFQVHDGGKVLAQFKDIQIEELPPTLAKDRFVGVGEPGRPAKPSPLSPEEERASFKVPPGFEVELVAADPDVGKLVTVTFDDSGRMWGVTALEYPLDGNESPEQAKELYRQPGRDRVVIWDTPTAPGLQKARTFADGLAMPMGVLPYQDGAFIQHGQEILRLRDTNGDGRADQREVILSGFGVQDSHLFPHQFTRAPGGWIMFAQGAFNYSQVRTKWGEVTQFDHTKLARFTPDGAKFEILGYGPCNIWGLTVGREGEIFIQEANDYGYPVMPFHEGGNYPGCGDFKFKPYAPFFPGPATTFAMGGTGLSGLAYADDRQGFPAPYRDVMYVANPITRRIQAIKIHRDGPGYQLQKLPDFITSPDEWFRPVAIHFGPDGCLYIVDWYNQIISHNEVPRNHPDRDKSRGRVWRVRHQSMPRREIPDVAKAGERTLVNRLASGSTWEMRAAWHQIEDRKVVGLAPELKKLAESSNRPADQRIHALWSLEGLRRVELGTLRRLLADANRNVRREAIRAARIGGFALGEVLDLVERHAEDADPEVRAEIILAVGGFGAPDARAIQLLTRMGKAPLANPVGRATHNNGTLKIGPAYEREFERYLVRARLENHPMAVMALLDSPAGAALPLENRVLATLALEPGASARRLAALLPGLERAPEDEEIGRLALFLNDAEAVKALEELLARPASRLAVLESLARLRNRLEPAQIEPFLTPATKALWAANASDAARDLAIRLVSGFRLAALEPELVAFLNLPGQPATRKLAALRALRESGAGQPALFATLAKGGQDAALAQEAIAALAASKSDEAALALLELWPLLSPAQRRVALDRLAASATGAHTILRGITHGVVGKEELDGGMLDKMKAVLGENEQLMAITQSIAGAMRPLLRLDGGKNSYVNTKLALSGPFTVETWVKLDQGIGNEDGILGSPGGADFNFFDRRLRVYGGTVTGDRVVARKPITPDVWTHFAITRDAAGAFQLFVNGELDSGPSHPLSATFTNLDVGRTTAAGAGTGGWLTEFRVWKTARSADEIRATFDQGLEGGTRPEGLAYFSGDGWGKLNGQAAIVRTTDYPDLVRAATARDLQSKFDRFRELANRPGSVTRGQALFAATCQACHTVQGQGANLGPTLNGAGAMGVEALLRAILTPNAAMEAGYRRFRVETKDNELLEGLLASQDAAGLVLRMPNSEDQRIPATRIKKAGFTKLSLMPEGLLEGIKAEEVSDLFSYLKTLK